MPSERPKDAACRRGQSRSGSERFPLNARSALLEVSSFFHRGLLAVSAAELVPRHLDIINAADRGLFHFGAMRPRRDPARCIKKTANPPVQPRSAFSTASGGVALFSRQRPNRSRTQGSACFNSKLSHLINKSSSRQSQPIGRSALPSDQPVRLLQCFQNMLPIGVGQRARIALRELHRRLLQTERQAQHRPGRKEYRALDDILQFTNVAWPVVRLEGRQHFIGKRIYGLVQAGGNSTNALPFRREPIFSTSPQFGQSTQMLGASLGAGGQNGGLNPLYQVGGPGPHNWL